MTTVEIWKHNTLSGLFQAWESVINRRHGTSRHVMARRCPADCCLVTIAHAIDVCEDVIVMR